MNDTQKKKRAHSFFTKVLQRLTSTSANLTDIQIVKNHGGHSNCFVQCFPFGTFSRTRLILHSSREQGEMKKPSRFFKSFLLKIT